eukprot:CAMPEP_0204909676 /NCGR_PEP_ID=MMETSP1397-20131031/8357_1 /ASSEMBLY_ACC=CAM_ASM_000891 /TAXON_ID=49980 /ORGANISM="Climacostomum Climacostomum virens, Strain Stock W-24" /LENGTH=102 /DNA_ID=CAMNT_0052079585 /DNA_START=42 /DNA_END=348 /DNA_ORIENTATION=-
MDAEGLVGEGKLSLIHNERDPLLSYAGKLRMLTCLEIWLFSLALKSLNRIEEIFVSAKLIPVFKRMLEADFQAKSRCGFSNEALEGNYKPSSHGVRLNKVIA